LVRTTSAAGYARILTAVNKDRTRIASAPQTDRRLQVMADNPLHQRNADELTRSDVVLNMERSIIESAATAARVSLGLQRGVRCSGHSPQLIS